MILRRVICIILVLVVMPSLYCWAFSSLSGYEISVSAPSAILIERETGTVIYEKEADEKGDPASITKIMTMLLITEAIESGNFSEDDIVTASRHAASFGGSCVYLEAGEKMTVSDMLKCIAVVSANDCAVAMAEYIGGTEERFTELMNKRAVELGLSSTHFKNCTGLFDDPEHYTTPRDVAILSRELLGHELIKKYTTIWTDSIRDGEFELSSTNKLVYWYEGCTGLKTGYTEKAKYCLSASAERDGVEYIAVVMHAESSEKRNEDAMRLLDYGFQNFRLCPVRENIAIPEVYVEMGEKSTVAARMCGVKSVLVPRSKGMEPDYEVSVEKRVKAPVVEGDRLGTVNVTAGGELIASIPVTAAEDVRVIGYFGLWKRLAGSLLGI